MLAVLAMHRGWELGRRLSKLERLTLAVASTHPTHLLTLTSKLRTRAQFIDSFETFKLLVALNSSQPDRPLVYFGSLAHSYGEAGWHAHLLIWRWPHIWSYRGHATQAGLQNPHAKQIGPTLVDRLNTTAYVLSQHEPVFGSDKHLENQPLDKYAHRYLRPQDGALAEHHPNLFRALGMANDQSLSDQELCRDLPILVRDTNVIAVETLHDEKPLGPDLETHELVPSVSERDYASMEAI